MLPRYNARLKRYEQVTHLPDIKLRTSRIRHFPCIPCEKVSHVGLLIRWTMLYSVESTEFSRQNILRGREYLKPWMRWS